ncbi:MAG TPA: hypothetical protein VD841_08955 [Arthrobacter sp.]|nr:hypothetical protein [Arthrobacter sp.]
MAQTTVWAEDGGVFLRDVLSSGHLGSILLPYDGYLHILPRAVAAVAHALVPLQDYAVAMSMLSCLVIALIAVGVFSLSRSVTESVPLRLMIAAIPILLPIGPKEVLGNAANLHWYLLWLVPWLLLFKPKSVQGGIGMFAVAAVSAASEIISGMFLPLAVWAAVKRRNFAAPAGLLLGITAQVLTTLTKPRGNDELPTDTVGPLWVPVDPLSVLWGFGLLPVGSIWHADSRTLASNIIAFGGWALVIPCLLLLALLAYTLLAGRMEFKLFALGALTASALCWTAAVVVSGKPMFNYANYTEADWATGFGYMRYAATPAMFLLLLVPIAAAAANERRQLSRRLSALIVSAFIGFLAISYFPASTARDDGPAWSTGVEAARAACVADPALTSAVAVVAPVTWKFADVRIPCESLR